MRNQLKAALLFAGLSVVAIPLSAHHGNAAYDTGKIITVKGTVTEWIWANPHCFLKMDAPDEKGVMQHWLIEANNPPSQLSLGWKKTSFKSGDEVTVTLIQAKNGSPIGRFTGKRSVVFSNGQVLSSDLGAAREGDPAK